MPFYIYLTELRTVPDRPNEKVFVPTILYKSIATNNVHDVLMWAYKVNRSVGEVLIVRAVNDISYPPDDPDYSNWYKYQDSFRVDKIFA